MSVNEIVDLLDNRPGAPEPTLLPWLARRMAEADLSLAARAAAAANEPRPYTTWPVVADAVAEVLADRARDSAQLGALVEALPSIAGHLDRSALSTLPQSFVRHDALAYASLAGEGGGLTNRAWQGTELRWREILQTATGGTHVLPLADLGALAWHIREPESGPYRLSEARAVYLLPLRQQTQAIWSVVALDAIEMAADEGAGWYAAALCARALPYLAGWALSEIAGLVGQLDLPWSEYLIRLAREEDFSWRSAEAEIAASHPEVARLTQLSADIRQDALEDVCRDAVDQIIRKYGMAERWEPSSEPNWYQLHPHVEERRLEQLSAPPPDRLVSTGFSEIDAPGLPLDSDLTLRPDHDYFFWFNIGERAPGSIETQPVPLRLPSEAGSGTRLVVALFSFAGELLTEARRDVGWFVVGADESIIVDRQPTGATGGGTRLYFPVHTPGEPGRYRLRCNLYCKQVLLQSRLVEVDVSVLEERRQLALTSIADYLADTALDPRQLTQMPALTLSIFINNNGDGTNGLRFVGMDGHLKEDIAIGEGALQDHISRARKALSQVAWGSEDEWAGQDFRYDRKVPDDPSRIQDLIHLASTGARLWSAITGKIGRAPQLSYLRRILRRPGVIEIAGKDGPGPAIPASIIYDYWLDSGKNLKVCAESLSAIKDDVDLAGHRCFQGECPSYEDDTVVCPGGFWGFRHQVGLPQSRMAWHADSESRRTINAILTRSEEQPTVFVGINTQLDEKHPQWVYTLGKPESSKLHNSRDEFLDSLRNPATGPHLIYLYCHGMIDRGIPMLLVGRPDDNGIAYEHIADGRVSWPVSHPLVFLNGCNTAVVEPRYAMSFVQGFIQIAEASGVVGTEITIYESLASRFARCLLDRFVTSNLPIASAIRLTRLELLKEGDPLGLAYVAYSDPRLLMRP